MIRIKIGRNGRLGNKMFQYMYCRYLQQLIPHSRVENLQMPEFNLVSPDLALEGRVLEIRDGHRHSMNSIAYLLREGIYENLLFDGYVQRLEYYPSRDFCSALFRASHPIDLETLGADQLLINIRAAEILAGPIHGDYGPVAVDFYSQVAEATRLAPVVMGQLGDDAYSHEIRRRFSGCKFIESVSAITDFEIIRNAKNIVISVSTFSWLAAWLSDTATQIHMPVSGFYNPKQRKDVDLLPIADPRYTFYEFPVESWCASESQKTKLLEKGRRFTPITAANLRLMIT